MLVFSLKNCNDFPGKKPGIREGNWEGNWKGTGRELEGNWERERELEKHRTSHALKTRKWKNTAFSITPGKGNWTKKAFSITPGKGNWKNTAVASTARMGTEKAQHAGGPSRHGQLKWVLSSTFMAISCDDLFFEKRQVSCQCKEMEEIKLLRDTRIHGGSHHPLLWRCDWLCFSIMG